MDRLRFEIFMPFYGEQVLFRQAVDSVRNQSNSDWQLTIVDDCYPSDDAMRYVASLNDPRIHYLRNKKNLGISANFQQCVQLAKAEFFSVMGCDDVLLPNYVAHMAELIVAHPQTTLIQPGVIVIDEMGRKYNPLGDRVKTMIRNRFPNGSHIGGEQAAASLAFGCWTYFPSIAWRTNTVQNFRFRQDYRIVLDLALQFDLLAEGGTILVDNLPAFAYRRHRHSASMMSAKEGSRFIEEAKLFAESSRRFKILGWNAAARSASWHLTSRFNLAIAVAGELLQGHFANARNLSRILFRPADMPNEVN
jgi:glycosyltransferase involved in cell wall biosynthesis